MPASRGARSATIWDQWKARKLYHAGVVAKGNFRGFEGPQALEATKPPARLRVLDHPGRPHPAGGSPRPQLTGHGAAIRPSRAGAPSLCCRGFRNRGGVCWSRGRELNPRPTDYEEPR